MNLTTPDLKLLSTETSLSLHLTRSLSGMDPVPATNSSLPDFIPVQMFLWAGREDRTLGPLYDFGCLLQPENKDAGVARWTDYRKNGYPAAMPEWVRTVSDELYESLTEGTAHPEGEVSVHGTWQRRYALSGAAKVYSFDDGVCFTPSVLSVAAVTETGPDGTEAESYRIALYGPLGSKPARRWIAPRLQGYAEDVPVWAKESLETLREEMVASARP